MSWRQGPQVPTMKPVFVYYGVPAPKTERVAWWEALRDKRRCTDPHGDQFVAEVAAYDEDGYLFLAPRDEHTGAAVDSGGKVEVLPEDGPK